MLYIVAYAGMLAVIGLHEVGYGASIGVNIGLCGLVTLVFTIINQKYSLQSITHIIVGALYGFFWSHHLHFCLEESLVDVTVLSYITIAISLSCVLLHPVR
jgi:hypothetical protein